MSVCYVQIHLIVGVSGSSEMYLPGPLFGFERAVSQGFFVCKEVLILNFSGSYGML